LSLTIRPTAINDLPSLVECLNSVFAEKLYLSITEPILIGDAMQYHANNIAAGCTHFVAVEGDRVIGLCDVTPTAPPRIAAQQHNGTLGMLLAPAYRGRGFGEKLLVAALAATSNKFERIELSVYSHNERAHRLYQRVGFVEEGRRIGAWKLDGITSDIIDMVYFTHNVANKT
jgi:RimJ/RimL family protein N-acetyltransferase